MIYRLQLHIFFSLLVLFTVGCGKVYNSSTYDPSTYGTATGTPTFLAAKAVLNQHCSTCHTRASHAAWAGMAEKDFINQGLVAPGELARSQLYTKIYGNRAGVPGNMPIAGSALAAAELTAIENWIVGIQL